MKSSEKVEIFKTLKKVVKTKGRSYRDLAPELGMSESGLKKLMASEDCSLSKLSEICSVLNISLNELVNLADTSNKESITFTDKQEREFIKNPSLYYYFISLLNFEYSEAKVRKKYKLTKNCSVKYLLKLDKLDLIRLEKSNKVFPVLEGKGVGISPKLAQAVKYNIDSSFVNYFQGQSLKKKENIIHGSQGTFLLRDETLKEMKKELSSLVDEFSKRSSREQILFNKKDLKEVTSLFLVAKGFKIDDYIRIEEI